MGFGEWWRRQQLASARGLQKAFLSLGNVMGKTEEEVSAVVGPPNSRNAMAGGYLLQWMATDVGGAYHVSLMFGPDGRCQGIVGETAV